MPNASGRATIGACCPDHDPVVESIQCCWECPDAEGSPEPVQVDRLDVHAALNTYEMQPGEPHRAVEMPGTMVISGSNSRRLVARWTAEGVWVGGCLITDRTVAEQLAAFITREADE